MRCPDCGSDLTEIQTGAGSAHRCFKCGGFWVDSATASKLDPRTLASWNRISADPAWLSGGSGLCPQDQTALRRFTGQGIAPNLVVLRCDRCGKWWFGGEALFDYKPVTLVKAAGGYTGRVIPALAIVVILLAGLLAGIQLVSQKVQVQVPAYLQK